MNNFLVTVGINVQKFLENMYKEDRDSHGTVLSDHGVGGIIALTTKLSKEEVEKVQGTTAAYRGQLTEVG